MRMSKVSAELRRVAAGIDRCERPRPDLVTRDLMRVAAAVDGTPFHMVVTDEPQGVAVGFVPSQEALDAVGGVLDPQWVLVEDEGTDDVSPLMTGWEGNEVVLRAAPLTDEERDGGMSELGMDLLVWRDEASMLEDLTPGD